MTLVKDVVEVSTGKQKQDVKVGHESGVGLVILWEENFGELDEKNYILKSFQYVNMDLASIFQCSRMSRKSWRLMILDVCTSGQKE